MAHYKYENQWEKLKMVHCQNFYDWYILNVMFIWLVGLRIYVALAIFQPYRDMEAGDNQSLKS